MKQIVTTGIVLTRTNFQEADRIITVLTPDQGKLRMIAKGVRRAKSKLAGGIELFCISQLTYMPGRGELARLLSSRIETYYSHIVSDINRTMFGYDLLKRINKVTEDAAGAEYIELLAAGLSGLDRLQLPLDIVDLWFTMQLLKITGHAPNLQTDTQRQVFENGRQYIFSFDDMAFVPQENGPHPASLVKVLRLAYGTSSPRQFGQVQGVEDYLAGSIQLSKIMLNHL